MAARKCKWLAGVLAASLVVTAIFPAGIVKAAGMENAGVQVIENVKGAESDFVIEDGVLTKYNGEGGDVVIPEGVTSIGWFAFYGCNSLTSVAIPEGVTKIDYGAFAECSSLISVKIPSSVTIIRKDLQIRSAFDNCNSLEAIEVAEKNTVYSSENGILYNKDKSVLITCPGGKKGEVTIPEGVTEIDYCAFDGCSSITGVEIPKGMISIESYAFRGCSSLTNMTIPDGVTEIMHGAFVGCGFTKIIIPSSVTVLATSAFPYGLSLIEVVEGNAAYSSKDGILYNKDKSELLRYPAGKKQETVNILKGVKKIGEYAFRGCSNLTSVTIPVGVTSIESFAFLDCSRLKSVVIPSSVTSIEDDTLEVFDGCENLTILCPQGSYAETYAKNNNIPYCYIEESVEKMKQTITAKNITKTYGDKPFSIGAKTDGDGTLSYTSDNEKVAVVDKNGVVTLKGIGTAHITITVSETDNYLSAQKIVTVTVKKAEEQPIGKKQTITAKNITKTYGAKSFSIGAKTNGDGKLSYTVKDKKVAVVDKNGKVTIKGYGKTSITIKAAETEKYKSATKTITLTVKPKALTGAAVKSTKAKTMTVTWKKDTRAKGYLIQYTTDKNFKKDVKTVTITKNQTTTKTISKLKAGKKYYVRICAYAVSGKTRISGSYGKAKSVKVK